MRHDWYVVDATNQVLGRLATRVAWLLAGKHRPGYVPYLDIGDFVIVTNAAKVRFTGRKLEEKLYRRHTGYPGGLREARAREVQSKHWRGRSKTPFAACPKSKLGRKQIKKLKVYGGPTHPHDAQKPKPLAAKGGSPEDGGKLTVEIQHRATGRRKTSMARVRLVAGTGAITVNQRSLDDYFPNNVLKMIIKQPLLSAEAAERFGIHVRVRGGGASGQGGAIRHGISRALTEYNAELRKKAHQRHRG